MIERVTTWERYLPRSNGARPFFKREKASERGRGASLALVARGLWSD